MLKGWQRKVIRELWSGGYRRAALKFLWHALDGVLWQCLSRSIRRRRLIRALSQYTPAQQNVLFELQRGDHAAARARVAELYAELEQISEGTGTQQRPPSQ